MIARVGAGARREPARGLPARGTTDELRDRAGAAQSQVNVKALLDACRAYPRLSNAERITFEYVMLKGVSPQHRRTSLSRHRRRHLCGQYARWRTVPLKQPTFNAARSRLR